MYIVRKTMPNGVAIKNYEGWTYRNRAATEALDLTNAQRFTSRERERITLPKGQEFIWFGCYRELK